MVIADSELLKNFQNLNESHPFRQIANQGHTSKRVESNKRSNKQLSEVVEIQLCSRVFFFVRRGKAADDFLIFRVVTFATEGAACRLRLSQPRF